MKGDRIYNLALKESLKEDADLGYVFSLLEKAKNQKNPKAVYALGTWYLFGKHVDKDTTVAFNLFQEAASNNISEACYDLAVCYEKGTGITTNLHKAFQYYLKAALLGDKKSIYEIGRCYYHGIGIKKDSILAEIWLDSAEYYGISDDSE